MVIPLRLVVSVATVVWLLCAPITSASPATSEGADARAPSSRPTVLIPVTLQLDIPPAQPGGTTGATVIIEANNAIEGFSLLMQFEPGPLLSTSAADLLRNEAFLPAAVLGDHALNTAINAVPGRIRIIGLAPVATTGPAEIGTLRLHIAPDAPIGATQVITLTGEVNLDGVGVVAIEPVTATVRVVSFDERVYLPLIVR